MIVTIMCGDQIHRRNWVMRLFDHEDWLIIPRNLVDRVWRWSDLVTERRSS
jgi:hypothetical protein